MMAMTAQMVAPVMTMIPRCCQSRLWYMRILYDLTLTIRTVPPDSMVRLPIRCLRRVRLLGVRVGL